MPSSAQQQKISLSTLSLNTCKHSSANKQFKTQIGTITYTKLKNHAIVIGDPICKIDQIKNLITLFLITHPKTHFMQISTHTAQYLKDYYITPIGNEEIIDLDTFKLSWKKRKALKKINNQKHTLNIQEINKESININQLNALKKNWLNKKKIKKELTFIFSRPFNQDFPSTRYFIATTNNHLVGLKTFDPLLKNNICIGYAANHTYITPYPKLSISDLITLTAIKTFKQEKKQILNLGLSPFKITTHHPQESLLQKLCFTLLYQSSPLFFPFKSISQHKQKYHAHKIPMYFASKHPLPLKLLYTLYEKSLISPPNTLQSKTSNFKH